MRRPASVVAASLLILISPLAVTASSERDPVGEVEHLLSFVETSQCQFERNGTWYDAREARDHLRRKYALLVKRERGVTAADFIEHAATASSTTGRIYRVHCQGGPVLPTAAWLREELERYRGRR